jgi:hypothetical protein
MAAPNQIVILGQANPEYCFSNVLVTSGGTATISRNTPTKGADAAAASWTGAVVPMVDGDGSTDQRFTGIAKSDSTDTASANGGVELWAPLPGYRYASKAKTASNANTAALIQALFGKRVVLDLTASVWTVDSAAADAVKNCVVIAGGDYTTSTLHFFYAPHGACLDFCISA